MAVVLLGMALVASRRPGSMALPVLGAAGFLVHPEAVMVYPLYLAISWGQGAVFRSRDRDGTEKKRSIPVSRLAVLAVLLGGVTAARLVYFHDWAPNTFHAKPSDAGLAVANAYGFLTGENSSIAFPITGWLAIAVLALGYARLRRSAAGRRICWRQSAPGSHLRRLQPGRLDRFAPLLRPLPARGAHAPLGGTAHGGQRRAKAFGVRRFSAAFLCRREFSVSRPKRGKRR